MSWQLLVKHCHAALEHHPLHAFVPSGPHSRHVVLKENRQVMHNIFVHEHMKYNMYIHLLWDIRHILCDAFKCAWKGRFVRKSHVIAGRVSEPLQSKAMKSDPNGKKRRAGDAIMFPSVLIHLITLISFPLPYGAVDKCFSWNHVKCEVG